MRMRRLLSVALLVGLGLASSASWAALQYRAINTAPNGSWFASPIAACGPGNAKYIADRVGDPYEYSSPSYYEPQNQCSIMRKVKESSNPPDGPYLTTGIETREGQPEACTGDYAEGKTPVINWTVGYMRTADDNDFNAVGSVNKIPPVGGKVCMGGCQMEAVDQGTRAWRSQSPTVNGLYRGSLDVTFRSTGTACSTPSPAAVQDQPLNGPECPGYVGEVNGKKGCYGTADKPITPVTAGDIKDNKAVQDAGNPPVGPAGNGQASGADRTPSTGAGGPQGGPAGAAIGGKGGTGGGTPSRQGNDGTVTGANGQGKEYAPCGAPGQPKCDVRVDESGTPTQGDFTGPTAALDGIQQSASDLMSQAHSIAAPAWTFSFQLPTGCSSYSVGTFKGLSFNMNPCQYQGTIHDLMSMIWAAVTAFLLISMVGKAIRES